MILLKAEITPSQRLNERPHQAWVALTVNEATVIAAHCSCMAGLGESCSHIAALLFKIEAAVCSGFTRRSCTEEACSWNVDFVKKIEPAEIWKVIFYANASITHYNAKRNGRGSHAGALGHSTLTVEAEQHIFLQSLTQQQEAKPVVLHAFSEYCDSFISVYNPPVRGRMPTNLRDFFSR